MGQGENDPAFTFGSMVRTYRRESGLTQRELAAKAGLSVATLRDVEQGRRRRPRPSSVASLASALGLDSDQAASLARAAALPRQSAQRVLPSPRAQGGYGPARTADASGSGQGLWLSALGPLEAWHDGAPLSLGPPARRAVLGLLLLDPGALVRRDTIVDMLWGDAPPSTAVSLVQAHVSRIRRLMKLRSCSESSCGVIDSVGGSYRLSLSAEELDLLAFRELAARAASARAAGDDLTAADFYQRAVGLWRGEPLADVDLLSGHPGVTALRIELTDLLLRYAEVACALGRHHLVLPRLQALADAEPLNESAHARLIIALACSGQQAAAIGVYEDIRLRLDRELGLYPCDELSEAYARVLRQDIRQGNREGSPVGPPALPAAVHVVPRQLPAPPRGFTGRADELQALSGLLEQDPGEPSDVPIAVLTGMAGIGKTTLAVQWAHQVASQFPDGQLHVNLRGFGPSGPPVTPAEAIPRFLEGLGVEAKRIPADLDAQIALYRSLLAVRSMLVVLDNARDAAQIQPLLPGAPGCLVLVTSRSQLTELAASDGAHLLTLDVLSAAEARELLVYRLGQGPVAAEPGAVTELAELCDRLPLALSIVAARAATRPGLPLAGLAAELCDSRARLDGLGTRDLATDVRTVFSWSCQQLSGLGGRMFRLIGLHPGPDITVQAAASLAGVAPDDARQALAELARMHLVIEHAPGRYSCHDLLRVYAAEQAARHESDSERHAAVLRVLDHYLHTAEAASRLLAPNRRLASLEPPQPGVAPEEPADRGQVLEWFRAERQVLLAAISQAATGGFGARAWQLPWAVAIFFDWQGHWHDLATTQESALAAAQLLGDEAGQAEAHRYLGWARNRLGDRTEATAHLASAIELAQKVGSSLLQATAHLTLARILDLDGRHLEALSHTERSLQLYRAAGQRWGEASALNAAGWCHAQLGAHHKALDYCRQALVLHRRLGNRASEASTLDSLGYAHHLLGHHGEAIACYQEALGIYGNDADRRDRAGILTNLGDAQQAAADPAAARRAWQQALAILEELGDPAASQVRSRLTRPPAGKEPAGRSR